MPEDNISTPTPINADPAPEQKGGGGFLKGKAPIFLAIGGTVVLAGIAVFTAVRLYQLRQQGVTPTAPEQPQAQIPTSTPTPTPSPTPVSSLTLTPTGSLTPTVTPRLSPTASVSAAPTKKPTATPTGTSLPDAGVSLPTIVGVSVGLLLLTISVLLAL